MIRILPAVADDAAGIMRLLADLDVPHWPETVWQEAIQSTLRRVVIARHDQDTALLGVSCVSQVLDEAELELIAVATDQRRLGIADALMRHLIASAMHEGMRMLMLEVKHSNHAAIALYHKHGFASIARRAGYYKDSGDALIMRRALIG